MISSSTIRRWIAGVFIVIAVGMVVLGQTVFRGHLKAYDYVWYWAVCMFMALLAALAAVFDLAAIRRQARREQEQLADETFKGVDPDDSNP